MKVDRERAQQLRAEGFTYEQIGRRLGVDHTSVMYAVDPYFRRVKEQRRKQRTQTPLQKLSLEFKQLHERAAAELNEVEYEAWREISLISLRQMTANVPAARGE